jgi:hypothetical protein
MTYSKNLGLLCALSALTFACNKETQREPVSARHENAPLSEMTPASRTRSAAEQIAAARCEREKECGNVGADKTYSSGPDCVARIQNDWKDELNSRECPGGINQHELDECVSQIRAEACGNPFDTLARITECTQGQICVEQP